MYIYSPILTSHIKIFVFLLEMYYIKKKYEIYKKNRIFVKFVK